MSHGPEMCAFTDEQRRERAAQAAAQAGAIAEEHGVTIISAFTNVVAHRTWLYVEADDASQIEQVLIATRMFTQNTCDIEAVRPLAETAQMLVDS